MSMISALIDELRELAGDGSMEWVAGPIRASVLRDAADTIWKLRDDLQRANTENSRMRDELESVGTAAYLYGRSDLKAENEKLREQGVRLFDKTLELGTENAKLRLLVEAMGVYERMDTDADPLRTLEIRDAIKQLAGELGIEVES